VGQPYVGEIRMFAGNFAPNGWMFCEGAAMPIAENEVLFQLIGTTYGGDGEETFNLPNLASRVPIHMGQGQSLSNYVIGETGGTESVTLTAQTTPQHSHPPFASADPSAAKGATGNVLGRGTADTYAVEYLPEVLSGQSITPVGGSQPHENMQPFLCINFIISLFGVFPSQT